MFSFFSRTPAPAPAPTPSTRGAAAGSGRRGGRGAAAGGRRTGGRRIGGDAEEPDAKYAYSKPDDAIKFYGALFASGYFADVEIVVDEGERIHGHSFVLASHSTFFATELRKIKPAADGKRVVELPEEKAAQLKVLIEFAYTQTWVKHTEGVVALRALAEKFGFVSFEKELAIVVAEMFKGNIHDALKVAAESWAAGDQGLARTAFLAAYKQPAVALTSPSLLVMSRECLASYLSDDRVTGSEIQVLQAVLRWAAAQLAKREEAGEAVEYAPWYVEERSRAAERDRLLAAAMSASASGAGDVTTAATAAAASGAGGGEDEESKEVEAEDATSLAMPGSSAAASSSAASSSASGIDRLFSVRSDGDSDDDLGGVMSRLFRLSSTGSAPGAAGPAASAPTKPEPGTMRGLWWKRDSRDRRVWDEWKMSYEDLEGEPIKHRSRFSGAALRDAMGPLLQAVRWPGVPAWFVANQIGPMELLTPEELVGVYQYRFLPPGYRGKHLVSTFGFSSEDRKPEEKALRIMMWGGGGASGKYDNSGSGGAGGYLCVSYSVRPGEKLTFYVGEGGYADKSSSEQTTQAWPNSGKGGFNWKTGSGGGASYFTSSRTGDDEVVAGAGGGGGGSAGRSYSSGGGGGGGTRDGKVGSGGDGKNPSSTGTIKGSDGNGDGGENDSGGSNAAGKDANGAGGQSGTGGTRSNGGNGGEASYKHAKLVRKINAKGDAAISCPFTSRSAGKGAPVGNQKRGSHGMIIVQEVDSGKLHIIQHDKLESGTAKTSRPKNTKCVLDLMM